MVRIGEPCREYIREPVPSEIDPDFAPDPDQAPIEDPFDVPTEDPDEVPVGDPADPGELPAEPSRKREKVPA